MAPSSPEPHEPPFHAEWEKRALAVTLACGTLGEWNIDISRHARETLPPPEYLTSSYYEIWTKALLKLLEARGLVGQDELAPGHSLRPAPPTKRPVLAADAVVGRACARRSLRSAGGRNRPAFRWAKRSGHAISIPTGHTRLPRYARGRIGVVERVHGGFVFPDTNAHGQGENPQWCYSVRFTGAELWGEGADPSLIVNIDCWEPYLEPAS